MVNLYQLQIFVAVSDRGSFSAAAEEFRLSQPGVSQHMRALEETYKVRLFNRNGPRIELTEAGQRLLAAARPLVRQAALLEESFSADLGELKGKLNLVYTRSTTTALYFLPARLAEFQTRHPGIMYSVIQMSEEAALEALLERQTHFVLLPGPPRHKSLESCLLFSEELVLALPPGHPWHNSVVDFSALKGQPFLLRTAGSETRRLVESNLRQVGLTTNDLRLVAEFDSAEGVVLAVQAGLGLGIAGVALVRPYSQAGQVGYARLQAGQSGLRRDIFLTRLAPAPGTERAPTQLRLWDFLTAHSQTDRSPPAKV